jgi:hypothetical protein
VNRRNIVVYIAVVLAVGSEEGDPQMKWKPPVFAIDYPATLASLAITLHGGAYRMAEKNKKKSVNSCLSMLCFAILCSSWCSKLPAERSMLLRCHASKSVGASCTLRAGPLVVGSGGSK